jgi:hypothetical protein
VCLHLHLHSQLQSEHGWRWKMENTDEQKRWKDEKPGLYMTRTRLLSFGIFPKILYISDVAPFSSSSSSFVGC